MRQPMALIIILIGSLILPLVGAHAESVAKKDWRFTHGYLSAYLQHKLGLPEAKISLVDGDVLIETGKRRLSAAEMRKLQNLNLGYHIVQATAANTKSALNGNGGASFFPGEVLFTGLLADPRWPHFSAAYQRFDHDPDSRHVAAVSFGETFPLWQSRKSKDWGRWQIGFQGAVNATFDLQSASKDLINADYMFGVPLQYRLDFGTKNNQAPSSSFSAQLRFYHQSSHLGDEYVARPAPALDPINLSYEAIDLLLSQQWFTKRGTEKYNGHQYRLYGGGEYILSSDPPELKPWTVQFGTEYRGPDCWGAPCFQDFKSGWIAGLDLQSKEEAGWATSLSLRGGWEFYRKDDDGVRLRLLAEYYRGRSPNGQFYVRDLEYFGFGIHVAY